MMHSVLCLIGVSPEVLSELHNVISGIIPSVPLGSVKSTDPKEYGHVVIESSQLSSLGKYDIQLRINWRVLCKFSHTPGAGCSPKDHEYYTYMQLVDYLKTMKVIDKYMLPVKEYYLPCGTETAKIMSELLNNKGKLVMA